MQVHASCQPVSQQSELAPLSLPQLIFPAEPGRLCLSVPASVDVYLVIRFMLLFSNKTRKGGKVKQVLLLALVSKRQKKQFMWFFIFVFTPLLTA
jgi:hypothetical protein